MRAGVVGALALLLAGGARASVEPPPDAAERAGAPDVGPGPVADFAEVAAVTTHAGLGALTGLPTTLSALLGPRHVVEGRWPQADAPDSTLVWMRDFQPLYVRRTDGTVRAVRYLSRNPNRTAYGERAPGAETLPLLLESGNLVSTGQFVFLTDRVFAANARPAPELAKHGYRPRTPAEVLATLARALERPPADLFVLPPMPGERTGHVDLFVMPLGRRAVLVPEVRDEAVEALTDPEEQALALDVQRFLDDQARRLATRLMVRRLAMLPPFFDDSTPDRAVVLYSPANALLLRAGHEADVVLPSFDAPERPALRDLDARYRVEWAAFFRDRGWTPRFVDATRLGRHLGLFRCVTAVTPSSKGR